VFQFGDGLIPSITAAGHAASDRMKLNIVELTATRLLNLNIGFLRIVVDLKSMFRQREVHRSRIGMNPARFFQRILRQAAMIDSYFPGQKWIVAEKKLVVPLGQFTIG
jgi:hypothetical protein